MVNTLKIGTLNVGGMKSPQSHDKFLILQQKSLDILAIQEAHCPENQFQSWKEFFSPKISYWLHYCGFIISPNQQFSNFKKYSFDNLPQFNDRMISIDIFFYNLTNHYNQHLCT